MQRPCPGRRERSFGAPATGEHLAEAMQNPFADFVRRLTALLRDPAVPIPDPLFNDLAGHLFRLQHQHVEAYRRFSLSRGLAPDAQPEWQAIPAVPTSTFKEFDWTSLPPDRRGRVFLSSGTTSHKPSRHYHDQESLALYEASVLPAFRQHLIPQSDPNLAVLALMPDPAVVPHSSLVHMLDAIRRSDPERAFDFVGGLDAQGGWTIQGDTIERSLSRRVNESRPVALLGTAFAFVYLLDHFVERNIVMTLPPGSRVMETGGYKGRTRALPKAALFRLIGERLGVSSAHIVSEFGMTELSSQAYDHVAGQPDSSDPRRFRFPPWARALVVSPETGSEVAVGETGLLRVVDLANVRSVLVVQTEDLARRYHDGFELLGRLSGAEPRGCSLRQLPEQA
jgi:hypothetical protein